MDPSQRSSNRLHLKDVRSWLKASAASVLQVPLLANIIGGLVVALTAHYVFGIG